MIVAAAVELREPRQQLERRPIQPEVAKPRAVHRTDHHEIAPAVLARELHAPPESAERYPFVRETLDLGIREAPQREQQHRPAALLDCFCDPDRERAGP